MKMPGLDGQNLYRMLARAGNPLRERFLFVTGDLISAHTQKFFDRYHLSYVVKPFRVEELSDKVKQVLAGKVPRETVTKKNAARNG